MAIAGIITEYNPFHKGHAYLLRKVRERGVDGIVVVMSGAFVQRGEPAVCSKRDRVAMALDGGADVVLELPLLGVLSSAQGFARAGVETLVGTGIVSDLYFGSECGDTSRLAQIAKALIMPELDAAIRRELTTGISYPAARQKALSAYCSDAHLLQNPNDLLGVEYILAAKDRLIPHAIARIGAAHDGPEGATACRNRLAGGESIADLVPQAVLQILEQGQGTVFVTDMQRAILSRLRRLDASYFANIPDVSEGLEHKIVTAVKEGRSWDEVVDGIKSKRYARSRICRILMRAYLDMPQPFETPEYIRILGFRKQAAPIVRAMRDQATVPIVQHPASDGTFTSLQQEITANDIWGAFAPRILAAGSDYRDFPVIKE